MVASSAGGRAAGYGTGGGSHGGGKKLPPDLQKFFDVTLGLTWPEGDDEALWSMAVAWKQFAEDLDTRVAELNGLLSRIPNAMRGNTADASVDWLKSQIGALQESAERARKYSSLCRNTGADIEKGKMMLLVMACMFVAMIAALIQTLIGCLFVPMVITSARLVLMSIIRWIFSTVLANAAKYAIGNAAFMEFLDVSIQGIQKLQGEHSDYGGRDDWDTESLKNSAIAGAIGGAGFGAGRGFAKGIGKAFGKGSKGPVAGGKGPLSEKGPGGKKALSEKPSVVEKPPVEEKPSIVEKPSGSEKAPGSEKVSTGEKPLSGEKSSSREKPSRDEQAPVKEKAGSAEEGPHGKPSVLGQLGYAALQVALTVPINIAVNEALGGATDIWAGMLGAAGPYHKSKGWSAKVDAAGERLAAKIGSALGSKLKQLKFPEFGDRRSGAGGPLGDVAKDSDSSSSHSSLDDDSSSRRSSISSDDSSSSGSSSSRSSIFSDDSSDSGSSSSRSSIFSDDSSDSGSSSSRSSIFSDDSSDSGSSSRRTSISESPSDAALVRKEVTSAKTPMGTIFSEDKQHVVTTSDGNSNSSKATTEGVKEIPKGDTRQQGAPQNGPATRQEGTRELSGAGPERRSGVSKPNVSSEGPPPPPTKQVTTGGGGPKPDGHSGPEPRRTAAAEAGGSKASSPKPPDLSKPLPEKPLAEKPLPEKPLAEKPLPKEPLA
ncbi:hypothetical protein, partial [Amycolatopsis minnesotensis]